MSSLKSHVGRNDVVAAEPACCGQPLNTSLFVCPQVLTILQEVFPAVKAAEMAVKIRPLWWEGWQTLGRAQLNLGEVDLVSVGAGADPRKWKGGGMPVRRHCKQRRIAAGRI